MAEKMNVRLSAYKRFFWEGTVLTSGGIDADDLAREVDEAVCGTDYQEDYEYWESGNEEAEPASAEDVPCMVAAKDTDGTILLRDVPEGATAEEVLAELEREIKAAAEGEDIDE
jgi:hypothetical protein